MMGHYPELQTEYNRSKTIEQYNKEAQFPVTGTGQQQPDGKSGMMGRGEQSPPTQEGKP